MIDQKSLFALYRQRTGRSVYTGDALRVSEIELVPRQVWQESRTKEYTFIGADA